jgi:hypothetical protein
MLHDLIYSIFLTSTRVDSLQLNGLEMVKLAMAKVKKLSNNSKISTAYALYYARLLNLSYGCNNIDMYK